MTSSNPPSTLEINRFAAMLPGPQLIVLGAVHGNETCGPDAIGRVVAELREGRIALSRGQITFVPVTNPLAWSRNTREGDRNLNRDLRERRAPTDNEDRIGNLLCPLLRANDVLLDLHSFTGPGIPFVFAGPCDNDGPSEPFAKADAEWDFARRLGVSMAIHGWLDGFAHFLVERERMGFPPLPASQGVGTTEYMRSTGGYGVTLECGSHGDPAGADVAYRAILAALAHLGLVEAPPPAATVDVALRITDCLLCESEGDRIEGNWSTGDAVPKGMPFARRADGSLVTMPEPAHLVFPNRAARPGDVLSYVAVPSERAVRRRG